MTTQTRFDPDRPPPPLMTGEPDSFAYKTMTTRIPAILEQVQADYAGIYPVDIEQALEALRSELVDDRPLAPLETGAADGPAWLEAWQPHRGQPWLNLPWYFAEAFFYRRLLEASGYFGRFGEVWRGVDPFSPRKQLELVSQTPWQVLALALEHSRAASPDSFRQLLHHCLWGNRVDLSYSQVAESSGRTIAVDRELANLLVDDTEAVLSQLQPDSNRPARLDSTRAA